MSAKQPEDLSKQPETAATTGQDSGAPVSQPVPAGVPGIRPRFKMPANIKIVTDGLGVSFGLGGFISGDEGPDESEPKKR